MFVRMFLLFACLAVSMPSMSHPAKGSWSGFMGPNAAKQERIRLLINAHNGDLSGVINPGRRGVDATSVVLDASTWTLTVRANMPEGELVMVGKLENLGSWTNRKYSGTYTMGSERGTFDVRLN